MTLPLSDSISNYKFIIIAFGRYLYLFLSKIILDEQIFEIKGEMNTSSATEITLTSDTSIFIDLKNKIANSKIIRVLGAN